MNGRVIVMLKSKYGIGAVLALGVVAGAAFAQE
jgi:hypothetical protein